MAYDLSNLKIVQGKDSSGNLTFKLTGMPEADPNYWHITSWSYRVYGSSDWLELKEAFGTPGNLTETSRVTLYTEKQAVYEIECDYYLTDGEQELAAKIITGEYILSDADISLTIKEIESTSISIEAQFNGYVVGSAYIWYVYANEETKLSETYYDYTSSLSYTITNLAPNTEYEIYVRYRIVLENSWPSFVSDKLTVKTKEDGTKVYIYLGTEKGWVQATPCIYLGAEKGWVQATPCIWNGSEWK